MKTSIKKLSSVPWFKPFNSPQFLDLNLLTPTIPIINRISSRQVMRIQKNINKGILGWSNTVRRVSNKIQDHFFLLHLNLLTPQGDQDRISPYNINTISSRKVMRKKKNINQEIISWSSTKFFKLTSQEPDGRQ